MKLKIAVIASLFFTPLFVLSENNKPEELPTKPSLSKQLQEKAAEIAQKKPSWIKHNIIKWGILGKTLQKQALFMEKFSKLSQKKQQDKIEKWLTKKPHVEMLNNLIDILYTVEDKKLDHETLEKFSQFATELANNSLKMQLICFAYGDLFSPASNDKKFQHEFKIKFHFHNLRKKEQQKFEERKKTEQEAFDKRKSEIQDLEDLALQHKGPVTW